jgi:hypothetical protein
LDFTIEKVLFEGSVEAHMDELKLQMGYTEVSVIS